MAIGKATATAAAPAAPKPARVSMNPGVFTAGGLIDDIDVEITDAATTMFDYGGTTVPSPSLAVELTDPNGATHVQYYSVGKPEDWSPDDAGEGFVAISGKTSINNSTNLGKFLSSLVDAGFPPERLDDGNLKVVIGTKCHVLQEVQERKGLIRTGKNADRPSTLLLVSKIHSLPGEGGTAAKSAPVSKAAVGGKANGGAKTTPAAAAPAAAPAAESGGDMDEAITAVVIEALSSGDGTPLAKKDLTKLVFQAFGSPDHTPAERNKAVVRCGRQDFLTSLADSGIAYDGASLSLAE